MICWKIKKLASPACGFTLDCTKNFTLKKKDPLCQSNIKLVYQHVFLEHQVLSNYYQVVNLLIV